MNDAKVLVIDDTKLMREKYKICLDNIDGISNVVEAVDGAEGIRKFSMQDFDLLIIDFNMPKKNILFTWIFINALKFK